MPRKTKQRVKVHLRQNPEKGGAWLCEILFFDETNETIATNITAWKNASAAKRHIKATIQSSTPRKSIKLLPGTSTDAKGKPTHFMGDMTYAVAA